MAVAKVLDDKYEILEEIKRGGFGVISYGRDRLFDKPIAVKAIPPELLGEAQYIDRFQAESLAVARLNHHNIIRIYDIKRDDDGQFYIIMEYVDGVDLRPILKLAQSDREVLPPHLSAFIVAEVCAGLDYAHTRRDPDTHQPLHLVHQDISPGNIMVNRLGEVKIIDFGLANARRRSHTAAERRNEFQIQGKLAYLPPELVNNAGRLDHRADLFSLGAVFFEMLTGQKLFKEQNAEQVVQRLLAGNWDLSALHSSNIPADLARITGRALQRDPSQRYQSANQMYLDLMHYLGTQAPAEDHALALGALVQKLAPVRKAINPALSPEANPELLRLFDDHEFAAPPLQPEQEFQITEAELVEQLNAGETGTFTKNGASETPLAPVEFEVAPQPETVTRESDSSTASPTGAFYRIIAEEEEEGEQRTIIDVVRLSARTHRKAILVTAGSAAGLFLLFLLVDVLARWTWLGAGVYDFLFPPAVRLVSFPPDAQVYLDDQPLPKTTPLAIERISPGVHKLTLTLPRFEPIVRSIEVPPSGTLSIAGEHLPDRNQPYIFRFKTILEISSQPEGAEIFLNGVKYTQPTPCRVGWEVGDPLQIELHKPGLLPLQGFTLNTLEGEATIEDRRLWRFEPLEEQREHYAVVGTFAKFLTISSTPSLAEIYVDGGENPVGLTGYARELLLAIGTHTITLQKAGYLPKTFTIIVDEQSPDHYHEMLSRVVRIFAKDLNGSGDNDIGAQVVELVLQDRRTRIRATTPCELTLLPYTYTALLTKDGYADYELTIPANSSSAIARMSPGQLLVEVVVLDENTGEALAGVEVNCTLLSVPGATATPFGRSDENGLIQERLAPGEYRFTASLPGYGQVFRDFHVTGHDPKRLVMKLSAL